MSDHADDVYLFYKNWSILQIIFANVSTKEQAPVGLDSVSAPFEVSFTYSVKWTKTRYFIQEAVGSRQYKCNTITGHYHVVLIYLKKVSKTQLDTIWSKLLKHKLTSIVQRGWGKVHFWCLIMWFVWYNELDPVKFQFLPLKKWGFWFENDMKYMYLVDNVEQLCKVFFKDLDGSKSDYFNPVWNFSSFLSI